MLLGCRSALNLRLARSVERSRLFRPPLALVPTRPHSALCAHLKMASTPTDKVKITQDSWQLPARAAGVEEPTIKVYNSLTRTKVGRHSLDQLGTSSTEWVS